MEKASPCTPVCTYMKGDILFHMTALQTQLTYSNYDKVCVFVPDKVYNK